MFHACFLDTNKHVEYLRVATRVYFQMYIIISKQYTFFLQMEMDVVKDIVDRQKLVRDRALERIKADLTNDNNDATKSLLLGRFLQLISANTYWEAQLGCLEAFCILLPHIRGQKCLENDKLTPWNDVIVKNLDCAESRVRKAAACSAGALVSACGFECYSFFRDLAVEKLKVSIRF